MAAVSSVRLLEKNSYSSSVDVQQFDDLREILEFGRKKLTGASVIMPARTTAQYNALWAAPEGLLYQLDDRLRRASLGEVVDVPDADKLIAHLNALTAELENGVYGRLTGMGYSALAVFIMLGLLGLLMYKRILAPAVDLAAGELNRANRLSYIVEQSVSTVIVTDRKGLILFANKQAERDTGYSQAEMIGNHTRMFSSGDTPSSVYRELWSNLAEEKSWHGQFCNRRKNGRLYWVDAAISPLRDEDGVVRSYVSVEHDVTEQRLDREQMALLKEQLNTAIEALDDGFALFDASERLVLCNQAYIRMWALEGRAEDVIRIGRTFREIVEDVINHAEFGLTPEQKAEFIQQRLAAFRAADRVIEQLTPSGRWVRATERLSGDGGRVALRTDITDLKATEEKLRAALDQAEAANKAKSSFLSSMSHELRTPLNAVLGFAQLMQDLPGEPLSKQQSRCISHILKGGAHLLELINQVLDLARIESGALSMSMESVTPAPLIEECVAAVSAAAAERGISIHVGDCGNAAVHADMTRLRQIVLNLLSNAVKYNRPDGWVRISFEQGRQGMLRISVSDCGEGIPFEKQTRLFQPFDRLGAENSGIEGTGIGLIITRELVEHMGGAMGFESIPGSGSTFWFELIKAETRGEIRVAASVDGGKIDQYAAVFGSVLYIEDNPANVELMETVFDNLPGVRLSIAGSAEQGIGMIHSRQPDLVLMDVNLSGISGIEAVRRLRDDSRYADLPIVALSADAGRSIMQKGLEAGFDRYVTKPINVAEVVALVDHYLGEGRDD